MFGILIFKKSIYIFLYVFLTLTYENALAGFSLYHNNLKYMIQTTYLNDLWNIKLRNLFKLCSKAINNFFINL